jgi:hypothetical protein
MAEKQFAPDADLKRALTSWLQILDTDFLYTEYKLSCHGRTKVETSIETTLKSEVHHLLSMCHVHSEIPVKFSKSKVSVTLCLEIPLRVISVCSKVKYKLNPYPANAFW